MKKLATKIALLFALFVSTANAQSYKMTDIGVKAEIDAVNIEIQFYTPSIVRVLKYPQGNVCTKQSLSVIKKLEKVAFRTKKVGDNLVLTSKSLSVSINMNSGQVSFNSGNQLPLFKEKAGTTSFTVMNDAGEKSYTVSQSFELEKDEEIYGLGQQQQGKMSKRNVSLKMVQGNLDDYIPFFQSVKGYGLFWDNYSPTQFDDNKEGTTFKSEVGDCIDYYFMNGGNADGVIACMRDLTGQAPMFPLWTYGFWQSRERYKTQDELVDVVKKYRELNVPLDGIIQDWRYWGNNYLWNAMEFLNPGFQDPQKMVDDVHALNAHMIISIWSSFGPMTKQFRELEKMNALFNFKTWPESGSEKFPVNKDYPSGVKVYDAYNPKARDLYWKYLNNGIFKLGMDGWWMDSTEPDHLDEKSTDFDNKTYLGSFRKVRNAYPLMTVGGVYQHQREVTSDKRVFILTRSAFAGQQRYGANTWSGDVTASWETLKNQISAGLNFSLSAIPNWNSDIGGFFLQKFKNPLENPDYRELQVRWMEFGAFCPMMRSHGEGYPREIYQFGKKGNPTYDAIEKYINLRYSLLPYIYSTSWQVTANQSSMMRALVMDFAADKQAINLNDEFMFGKSLLVSPVTKPMYWKNVAKGNDSVKVEDFSSVKTKEVYLPKGTDWYDFWTGEKVNGGQTIQKETPLDIIPLYVKAGSILLVGPKVQYATEKKWNSLEIRIYEGANGEFTLYEDENDNYNYEKGIYSTILFSWNDKQKSLTIHKRNGKFPGMLESRSFNIVIVSPAQGHGGELSTTPDKLVTYDGNKVVVNF
ncbi:TIM-barrel domain-containing protein [Prolixibacter sp. NT017]|uniref:glycoside hydrolase family 31 protein n=1 Tax=Prolixibacter sp. NT017 TaxID=2652390 RepID=UPI00128A804C|nr:TIM-barrel domain-containing protein [Prolixibacter sp. NT017]GET25675.1 xylosidase [Prolixibacter sp. NT017]